MFKIFPCLCVCVCVVCASVYASGWERARERWVERFKSAKGDEGSANVGGEVYKEKGRESCYDETGKGGLGMEDLVLMSAAARNRALLCMARKVDWGGGEHAGAGAVEWLQAADELTLEVVTCGWEEIDAGGSEEDRRVQDELYSLIWSDGAEALRDTIMRRKQLFARKCCETILEDVLGCGKEDGGLEQ